MEKSSRKCIAISYLAKNGHSFIHSQEPSKSQNRNIFFIHFEAKNCFESVVWGAYVCVYAVVFCVLFELDCAELNLFCCWLPLFLLSLPPVIVASVIVHFRPTVGALQTYSSGSGIIRVASEIEK